jgi:hypothetical protein
LFYNRGVVGFGEFVAVLFAHGLFKVSTQGRREVGPPDGCWTTYTNRTRFLYA